MIKKTKSITSKSMRTLSALLACVTFNSYAEDKALIFETSSSSPPYVIQETDSGLVLDIVKNVFNNAGYTLKFIYAPNYRVERDLYNQKADAAFPIPPYNKKHKVYKSTPIITFQNVVVTLKNRDFTINNVNDLHGLNVLAFQNASTFISLPFLQFTQNNPLYRETPNQKLQIPALISGRTDAIVLDKRIFQYHLQQLDTPLTLNSFTIHPIFNLKKRMVAFNNKELRDLFNATYFKLYGNKKASD